MEMQKINELRPIERLYLISMERADVYTKKAKMFCLLYTFLKRDFLRVKNKNLIPNFNSKDFPKEYESHILDLIKENKYLELDSFVDNKSFVFGKTLVSLSLLREEIKPKKFLFLKLAKSDLVKTPLYFSIQGYYSEKLENGVPILNLVCKDPDYFNKTKNAYLALKEKMIQANREKAAKENAKDVEVKIENSKNSKIEINKK